MTTESPASPVSSAGRSRSWTPGRGAASALGSLLRPGFRSQVAGTLGTRGIMMALGLITAVLTARLLGPEGRGLLTVMLTIGALGVQFGNLGLPSAFTYFVASDRARLPALLGTSLIVGLGIGTVIAAVFFGLAVVFPSVGPVGSALLLALAVAWIPFGILKSLLLNLLLGLQRVRAYNLIQVATKGAEVLLLVGLALAGMAGVVSYYGATALVLILGIGAALWLIRRSSAARPALPGRAFTRDLTSYGFKAYLATLFSYVVLHFDLLMVSGMLGAEDAGYYSIASRLAEMIYFIPSSAGPILFMTVAGMERGSWVFTRRVIRIVAVGMAPILVVAGVVAEPAVRILFGSEFLPAVPAFLWLLPAVYALTINTFLMQYFAGIGMPSVAVLSPAVAAVGNVVLNYLLLPRMGIAGAAVASVIAYLAMLVLSLAWIIRKGAE